MIHLKVALTNGDVFECDHYAKKFKEAVADILSQEFLHFNNVVINVKQIVSIENIRENDRVKGIPVDSGKGNKGSLS